MAVQNTAEKIKKAHRRLPVLLDRFDQRCRFLRIVPGELAERADPAAKK
jgi:hypothetical protein